MANSHTQSSFLVNRGSESLENYYTEFLDKKKKSQHTSRNLSQRYAGKNTKRRMYKAIHGSTIYVIPRLELIQMSISKELGVKIKYSIYINIIQL